MDNNIQTIGINNNSLFYPNLFAIRPIFINPLILSLSKDKPCKIYTQSDRRYGFDSIRAS